VNDTAASAPKGAAPALLPCAAIAHNPLNARRRQDKARMAGLVDSIRAHGVLQPIIVRPIAVPDLEPYQVVAGERRLMASQELGLADIPATVRELTDIQALELQLTENDHRDDVHPLDQAEGYERLLYLMRSGGNGATVEDLAARLGQTPGIVRARLRLMALVPQARSAFYDGKLTLGAALLVARMPAADQPKATHELITGDNGQPLSYREAQAHIERTYMLQLRKASWSLDDPTLIPAAGSCVACPKRTGTNTELFADIAEADMCTDSACFQGKRMAYRERQLALAREHNIQVLAGHDSTKYARLDEPFPGAAESDKPLREVIGDVHDGLALVEDRKTKDYHEVVPIDQVLLTLQHRGALKPGAAVGPPPAAAAPSPDRPAGKVKKKTLDADRADRIREHARHITMAALWAQVDARREERLPLKVLAFLALDIITETQPDLVAVNNICKLGWTWIDRAHHSEAEVANAIGSMEPDALARLIVMLVASDRERHPRLDTIARHYTIDTKDHQRLAAKDVDRLIESERELAATPEEGLAKAAKRGRKGKAAPVPSSDTARDARTGQPAAGDVT
jgi:ParB/RepB/Spo0J family partition protein